MVISSGTGLPVITIFSVFLAGASAFAGENFDLKKARKTFKKCASCHQIGEAADSSVGPVLNALADRTAGTYGDYKYSPAMRKAGAEGLIWNRESLDLFLKNPKKFMKKSKMNFTGIPKDKERNNIVSWLLTFDASGDPADGAESLKIEMLGASAAALEGDAEYGEYLAGECVTCHQVSGSNDGIPSIIGWPKANFIHAMYEYKTKVRDNPAMQTVAGRLADEELAALAAYFGALQN